MRQGYSEIAKCNCNQGFSCCGAAPEEAKILAGKLGYTAEELQALPEGANMGLSCGNPAALAALKEGEVVVDLGSGGGFDVFIAGKKVGATGHAIGVDMTAEMLLKARGNIAQYTKATGLANVEFRLGEIEHLPIADNSVDVIISNCVVNLSPAKAQVWKEIARVLKPHGRVAISDMALLQPLPEEVKRIVASLCGCVAGAVLVTETEKMAVEAGLVEIKMKHKPEYVDAMVDLEDGLYAEIKKIIGVKKLSEFIISCEVQAVKPGK